MRGKRLLERKRVAQEKKAAEEKRSAEGKRTIEGNRAADGEISLRGKRVKSTLTPRTLVATLLALVLVVSLGQLVLKLRDYRQGDADYGEAEVVAGVPDLENLPQPTPRATPTAAPEQTDPEESRAPDPESTPEPTPAPTPDPYAQALRNMDFAALQQVNEEVVGWILVPGTRISYPILQGGDNSYYLDHTWKGSRSSVGSIFMEWQCSRDFSDFNTIIYGHRVRNQSMFGLLHSYADQDFADLHPSFYITDAAGTRRYDIFAAYETPVDGLVYRLGVTDAGDKEKIINAALESSSIATPIRPTSANQIVTLSTCTGNGHANRWVVLGVLAAIE